MARRRGRLLRFLMFAVVLVAVLAGLVFVATRLLSPGFVTDRIVAAVKERTGRDLTIAGGARIGFWPRLSIRLNDVTLSNPPQMGGGIFLKVAEIDLAVEARPLLQRRLEVKRIYMRRPQVNLLVDRKGRQNWDFSGAATGSGATGGGSGAASRDGSPSTPRNAKSGNPAGDLLDEVRIAPILVEEGKVSYLDERDGTTFAASDVNLRLSLPTPASPLSLKGSAVWRQQPVKFALFVKAPQRLTVSGSPLEASIDAARLKASYTGLATLRSGFELAGHLEASTPSLRGMMRWLGVDMPDGRGLEKLSVRGGLDLRPDRVELKKATVQLDGMTARGTVRILTGGGRPKIVAALGVDRIDTNVYMAPETSTKAGGKTAGTSSTKGVDAWSNQPIDLSSLKAVDADLRLAVNSILYRKVRIGRSTVTAKLEKGVLDATLKDMSLYGGKASGRLVLDGSGPKAVVRGALNAKGLNGEGLLRDFADITSLKGTLDMSLSLAARGRSQQEMVSTLLGKTKLTFRDGAIKGINIARLVRTVEKAVVNGWKKAPKEKTDFAELSGSFDIRDGIAKTRDLKMLGPLVRLTGSGEVDLLRRKLDLRIDPKLVKSLKGQGGSFDLKGLPVPIIIRGPWDNPKIYPDIEGILKDPEKAYNTFRKLMQAGPAGFLRAMTKARKNAGRGAKEAAKAKQEEVERKATKELGKVVGEEQAEKAVKKTKKKAKKILKGIFR